MVVDVEALLYQNFMVKTDIVLNYIDRSAHGPAAYAQTRHTEDHPDIKEYVGSQGGISVEDPMITHVFTKCHTATLARDFNNCPLPFMFLLLLLLFIRLNSTSSTKMHFWGCSMVPIQAMC